jgi:hypothetical protein
VLDTAAEHVEPGGLALVEGHVPVLDAHWRAVDRAVVLADVTGREDPRHGAFEARRAAHAARIPELQPGRARESHVGHHPDPCDHEVAVQL